ncbi:hypothetical protein HRW07_10025 [Streptomyces lunaelactis]|uniref:hypothetical protein n=1 Tax=Streptomyces lunaelactis TaxID=1535768 RepID=UPI0015849FD2|nr:hypothetical protein [Streptomyces lunaelactis]NUL03565.1 hypothetical protein [Streptomyces lunaelactis]
MSIRTEIIQKHPKVLLFATSLALVLLYATASVLFFGFDFSPLKDWPAQAQIATQVQMFAITAVAVNYFSARRFIKDELASIRDPNLRDVMTWQWENAQVETVAAQRAMLKLQKAKLERDRKAWLRERDEWRAGVTAATYATVMDQAERGVLCLKCQSRDHR